MILICTPTIQVYGSLIETAVPDSPTGPISLSGRRPDVSFTGVMGGIISISFQSRRVSLNFTVVQTITGAVSFISRRPVPYLAGVIGAAGSLVIPTHRLALHFAGLQGSAGALSIPFRRPTFGLIVAENVTGRLFVSARRPFFIFSGALTVPEIFQALVFNAHNHKFANYENFPFHALAKDDGEYYGCLGDGIYHLNGDNDAGVQIDAYVTTGNSKFDSSKQKRILRGFLHLRSAGEMQLTLIADEEISRDYLVDGRSEKQGIHVKLCKPAKGIKANNWQAEVSNVDGCAFDLAGLELLYEDTQRH